MENYAFYGEKRSDGQMYEIQRARVYQVLALNEEMFRNGYISGTERDFVQRLQTEKLTKLRDCDTLGQ